MSWRDDCQAVSVPLHSSQVRIRPQVFRNNCPLMRVFFEFITIDIWSNNNFSPIEVNLASAYISCHGHITEMNSPSGEREHFRSANVFTFEDVGSCTMHFCINCTFLSLSLQPTVSSHLAASVTVFFISL